MSLTKKEIHTLAGQVDAACIIMREVAIALYTKAGSFSSETIEYTVNAGKVCDDLRKALRAIGYEEDKCQEKQSKSKRINC